MDRFKADLGDNFSWIKKEEENKDGDGTVTPEPDNNNNIDGGVISKTEEENKVT